MSEPSDIDDLQALAGEYVLGTLSADEREAFAVRLSSDPAARDAVAAWEARLLPLASLAAPVTPSPWLWGRIRRSLQVRMVDVSVGAGAAARPDRWQGFWANLGLWRGLAAAGGAAAILLGGLLAARVAMPPEVRYVVVLTAPQSEAPGWIVQASDTRRIRLMPLATVTVPEGKALQFWTKGEGWGAPVSLGLLQSGESLQVSLDSLPPLQPNQLFELTLEPASGSPTGRPTGPIQYIGRAVQVM
ncbi:anti-sigma factor [Imbroritus primus]|uniref:anti-sigma factor n=1 Tax=Imbroritus primus TaxID=3058603 RepID=UPI003D16104E